MKTYGRLRVHTDEVGAKSFVLEDLPPHVTILLKRILPRVGIEAAPPIFLSITDDLCRDLDWFLYRYPLEVTRDARSEMDSGIAAARRRQEAAEQILSGKAVAEHPAFREGEAPFPYQAQAAALCLANRSLLLADDVGLGKTVSAMALLAQGAPLPAAAVVQPHLAEQWKEEVEALTNLTVHVVKGTKPYRLPPADLTVFRYSNLHGWNAYIAEKPFPTVVWDEIQELRHGFTTAKGLASKTLAQYADVKLALTATPVFNYGSDIFNIMAFLKDGILGTPLEFSTQWCAGGAKVVKDPSALGHYLYDGHHMLRRTEKDVDKEQAPLNQIVREVHPALGDTGEIDDKSIELARQLLEPGSFMRKGQAARELDARLRQLTGVAKARSVAAYTRMVLEGSEKVLVGVWHRDVYDILARDLQEFDPVFYSGTETPAKKRKSREAFINGTSRVMLISLRSGAGLNGLQHVCSDVVLGEFDWSPQVHKQLYGRLRRIGQTKQVSAHVLWTDFGADPTMMDTLGLKDDQARGVTDRGQVVVAAVTDENRIKKLAEAYLARAGERIPEGAAA